MELPRVPQSPPARGALLYVLKEPAAGIVCYVGQTRRPRERLSGHIGAGRAWVAELTRRVEPLSAQLELPFDKPTERLIWKARPSREPATLEEWIALLVSEGDRPLMQCIETVSCKSSCGCTFVTECRRANAREAWWIELLLRDGQPILNRTLPARRKGDS